MVLGRGLLLALGLSATGISTALPSIVTCSASGQLALWRYSPKDRVYHDVISRRLPGSTRLTYIDGRLAVGSRDSLFLLDTTLATVAAKAIRGPRGVASVATMDGLICYSSDGFFTVCDTHLRVLDSAALQVGSGDSYRKDADDIVVVGRRAYLVDDLLYPLHVFAVALDTLNHLSSTFRGSFDRTNGHLTNQWVDTAAGGWAVVEDWGVMTGEGQTVHIFDLDSGGMPLGSGGPARSVNVWNGTWETPTGQGRRRRSDTRIVAAAGVGEPWVLLRRVDSSGFAGLLCGIDLGEDAPRYRGAVRLPRASRQGLHRGTDESNLRPSGTSRMRRWGDNLIIVTSPIPDTFDTDGRPLLRQCIAVYRLGDTLELLTCTDLIPGVHPGAVDYAVIGNAPSRVDQ